MGFYKELGYLLNIFMQKYENDVDLEPQTPFFGPKNGPK